MKPIDQLWIRACKSEDPKKRLLSVYRRFYCSYEDSEKYIFHILLGVCEKHCPIDPTRLVSDF